jgi:hypothetical protein
MSSSSVRQQDRSGSRVFSSWCEQPRQQQLLCHSLHQHNCCNQALTVQQDDFEPLLLLPLGAAAAALDARLLQLPLRAVLGRHALQHAEQFRLQHRLLLL